jgi:hypothetical protein
MMVANGRHAITLKGVMSYAQCALPMELEQKLIMVMLLNGGRNKKTQK